MKKGFVAVAVLIVLFMAVTGCSKAQAKDIQVVLQVNGEIFDVVKVNSFNNAVVKEPAAQDGRIFKGWTLQESWEESEVDSVPLIPNKGLVRYDDVKAAIKGNASSVILRAVFGAIPRRDLVVAWYSKESTSGLNQGHMDVFKDKLFAYLTSLGYSPDKMDIVIRDYNGNVGDTCAAITKDADVDITVGWSSSSNLTGTGGWVEGKDFLENVGGITIGAKARYSARISDTELSKLVYTWIQSEFGEGAAAPATPAAEPAPVETKAEEPVVEASPAVSDSHDNLVIAWYAKEGTSGMNQSYIDAFTTKLVEFLGSRGYSSDIVVLRGYDGKVGETCAAISADGDVDLTIGWSSTSNLTSTGGWVEGKDFLENVGNVTIGEKARYAARISDDYLSRLVFAWIQNEFGEGGVELPEAEAQALIEGDIVIAWYAKEGTSGMNQSYIDAFQAKLVEYLASQGYTTDKVVLRGYDGKVGETCAAITSDGDVDITIGWSSTSNLTSTGGWVEGKDFLENIGNITIGAKARYAARLTDTDLSKLVYAWILSEFTTPAN